MGDVLEVVLEVLGVVLEVLVVLEVNKQLSLGLTVQKGGPGNPAHGSGSPDGGSGGPGGVFKGFKDPKQAPLGR